MKSLLLNIVLVSSSQLYFRINKRLGHAYRVVSRKEICRSMFAVTGINPIKQTCLCYKAISANWPDVRRMR